MIRDARPRRSDVFGWIGVRAPHLEQLTGEIRLCTVQELHHERIRNGVGCSGHTSILDIAQYHSPFRHAGLSGLRGGAADSSSGLFPIDAVRVVHRILWALIRKHLVTLAEADQRALRHSIAQLVV